MESIERYEVLQGEFTEESVEEDSWISRELAEGAMSIKQKLSRKAWNVKTSSNAIKKEIKAIIKTRRATCSGRRRSTNASI